MSVKTSNGSAAREEQGAVEEAMTAANQTPRPGGPRNCFIEVGKVSRQFGHTLYQRLSAYTGSVDEFGCPGNTVDSWRWAFSSREVSFKAANAKRARSRSR
jgi:hypothetical protein